MDKILLKTLHSIYIKIIVDVRITSCLFYSIIKIERVDLNIELFFERKHKITKLTTEKS